MTRPVNHFFNANVDDEYPENGDGYVPFFHVDEGEYVAALANRWEHEHADGAHRAYAHDCVRVPDGDVRVDDPR